MDGEVFARQLSAWLNPVDVIDTARLTASVPEFADASATWTWSTPLFRSASDVGLDTLVTTFLDHFRVPAVYVRLLRHAWEEPIPPDAWDAVAALSFSGEVRFSDFPPDVRDGTVIWVSDLAAFVNVVRAPLSFLVEHVSSYAKTWLSPALHDARRSGLSTWLEHSSPGELSVYVESVVARAATSDASAVSVAVHPDRLGQNLRYAAVSAVGGPPFGSLDTLQDLARSHAAKIGYFSFGFV